MNRRLRTKLRLAAYRRRQRQGWRLLAIIVITFLIVAALALEALA